MRDNEHFPLGILGVVMGVSISNMFYSQSLLPVISESLDLSSRNVAVVPVMLQAGLLTSLVFLLPAGDLIDRRRMLRLIAVGASVSSMFIVVSGGFPSLLIAFYSLGFCSLSSYILPSYVSGLVSAKERGRVIGTLLSGQFAGILFSRFFSGVMASWFGWRSIYLVSAVLMGLVAMLWPRLIPRDEESVQEAYGVLMSRQLSLFWRYSVLRRACASQGFQFAAFVVVWTGLSIHLGDAPWLLGPAQIGAFGLVGLTSILSSAWIGRMVDRYGASRVITGCGWMTLIGVVGLMVCGTSILMMLVWMSCLDFGVQGSYVANQSRVLSLDLAARSRLGAWLFISAFAAAAFSGLLLAQLWPSWGWNGVLCLALGLALTAILSQHLGAPSRASRSSV